MLSQLERNKIILKKYIPEPAVDTIAQWVYVFDFKLRIRKTRSSKYGDYRPPVEELNHQITVNHDLNRYAFLITLIHEIAHLSNYNKNRSHVKPHGKEWKIEFKKLMVPFLDENIFPADIISALKKYLHNPSASSCSDINLMRVLKKYDNNSVLHLEQLPENALFKSGKKIFVKKKKVRKRFLCMEVNTRREYLFNPLAEIELVQNEIAVLPI